jgi:hypothetical protein
MKRISVAQNKQRDELLARLELADKAMQDAIALINSMIEGDLNKVIDSYNEVVADVETFRDELVGEMREYFDDRSDKWRDGEAGQAYNSWMGEWEYLDVSPVEAVEAIEDRTVEHYENLANLMSEVDEA